MAALTRKAYAGEDLNTTKADLLRKIAKEAEKSGPLMDLSIIEQLQGNLASGLDHQLTALSQNRLFQTRNNGSTKRRVLIFAAPIHMGGNTPVEFLLEYSDFEIVTYYVIPGMPAEPQFPDHDIAFVAAPGDSGLTRQFIDEIDRVTSQWPVSVLNAPECIIRLERDCLQEIVDGIPGLSYPTTARSSREELVECATNHQAAKLPGHFSYPFVLRPVGSHAGRGLEKIEDANALDRYLKSWMDHEFFLSQYIDYASPDDGLFRKYRVVFIDGKPFPVHMAISDQWKVWYLNAGMHENSAKRREEEEFMDRFHQDFSQRHKDCFQTLSDRIGLEYFGIDCAEGPDGNLILFEADNALIVHDMDSPSLFPYKKAHMYRLFDAFDTMLETRCDASIGPVHFHGTGIETEPLPMLGKQVL